VSKGNDGFGSIVGLEKSLLEVVGLSRDPDRLLRVVGSVLILTLLLQRQILVEGKKRKELQTKKKKKLILITKLQIK
jgi:hypothetical protein